MSTIIKFLDTLHLYRAAAFLCRVAHRRSMSRLGAPAGVTITSRRKVGG